MPDYRKGDAVGEKKPDIVAFTQGNLRPRVLPDDHFEFRGGGAATPGGERAQQKHPPMPRAREARLRPEHAEIYPCLIPDVWELAAVVVEKVMAWQLQQRRGLVDRDRVLDPRHFDFRESARPAGLPESRSRKTKPAE